MKTQELEHTEDIATKENLNLSEELLTFRNIENTPFTIVKHGEEYYGVIGNHRLTGGYEDEKLLEEELTKVDWNRLVQVIWAIVEKFKNIENEN